MTRHAVMEELSPLPSMPGPLEIVGRAFHSSRNLCMSMRGYAELIQSHPDALDRHAEWASKIIRQLDRLSHLYDNVERAWTRPGAKLQRVPLPVLLRAAERSAREGLLEAKDLPDTRWDLAGEGWILGHGPDLVRAFEAVVENALEAAPEESEVVVRLRGTSEVTWQVEVIDEGAGIPPEIESRVSEAFFSRKPGHVGLGLYLSQTILERHGCSLRVTSDAARGTCARITPRLHFPGGSR